MWNGLVSIEWLSEAKQAINLSRANGQTAISLFYLPIALPYSAGLNAHVYEVLTMVYKGIKSSLKEHSHFQILTFSWDINAYDKSCWIQRIWNQKKSPENAGVWN